MEELSPRLFSFNSPYGACPNCHGLGSLRTFAPELVVPDEKAPVYCADAPWSDKDNSYYLSLLFSIAESCGFDIDTPWYRLSAEHQRVILYGKESKPTAESKKRDGSTDFRRDFNGVISMLQRQYDDTGSDLIKQKLEQYPVDRSCEVCHGKRLKTEAL